MSLCLFRRDGIALVTGASRGIGRVVALELAARGWPVAVNYRQAAAEADLVVSAIRQSGGRAAALQADVSKTDEARSLVDRAEADLGPVQVLINNAGLTRDRLLIQMTEADWDVTWDTNLAGARAVATRAAQGMVQRGSGRIVNIGSVVGSTGNAGQANYAAAKSALLGFTRALALECAPAGVSVNCVMPGYIVTDATAHLSPEQQEKWFTRIPMRRYADTREVAEVIVFLAGEGASYLTGQCIAVDGGYQAAAGGGFAS